jgi:hypothetical protein
VSGREEEGDVEEKKKNGERRGRVAFKSPSQPPLPWSGSVPLQGHRDQATPDAISLHQAVASHLKGGICWWWPGHDVLPDEDRCGGEVEVGMARFSSHHSSLNPPKTCPPFVAASTARPMRSERCFRIAKSMSLRRGPHQHSEDASRWNSCCSLTARKNSPADSRSGRTLKLTRESNPNWVRLICRRQRVPGIHSSVNILTRALPGKGAPGSSWRLLEDSGRFQVTGPCG